jgi:translation initiation factor IF-2
MKTLTELSGSLVRTAAAAIAQARRAFPEEEAPVRPATVVSGAPPAPAAISGAGSDAGEAAPAADAAAVTDTAPAADTAPAPDAAAPAPPGSPSPDAAAAAPPKADAKPAGESEAVKAALDEAVAKATGLSGDRLAMLRAAVEVVGRRAADVRLVRVFAAGEGLPGATTVGEHQYVVDLFPQSMRQAGGGPEERGRGGRGGRGGRAGGGRGGGGGGKGAPASGGFSMDSLREDRKKEGRGRPGFGGRPGGGRGPGGGRPPGGGGGAPPGGTPKP